MWFYNISEDKSKMDFTLTATINLIYGVKHLVATMAEMGLFLSRVLDPVG